MLSVRNVNAFYGNSQALFGMSLEVGEGEVVTLIGRNGMGKTTTIHTIMGIVRAAKGKIDFEGEPIEILPSFKVAKRGIGLVPEGRQLFPSLSVEENLAELGFKEWEHYIPVSNQTLEDQIRYVLDESNHGALDKVRKKGQELVWERHKTSDRAQLINDVCVAT